MGRYIARAYLHAHIHTYIQYADKGATVKMMSLDIGGGECMYMYMYMYMYTDDEPRHWRW